MPSTINASNSGSGGIVQTADASGVLQLQTAGTTALTIDTSQNIGVGTSSPTQKLQVKGAIAYEATNSTNAWQIYNYTDNTLRFNYNGVGGDELIMDSSGNLGLGVTPSAWSGLTAFELGAAGSQNFCMYGGGILRNAYYNGTNFIYKATAAATLYEHSAGAHRWYNAPSGTSGNAITFTQAMTLDASGNLALGTTSAPYQSGGRTVLGINGSSNSLLGFMSGGTSRGYVYADSTIISIEAESPCQLKFNAIGAQPMTFFTNNTERARIDSSGSFFVGIGTHNDGSMFYSAINSTINGYRGSSSAGDGLFGVYSNIGGAKTVRGYFRCDGGLANFSANNINISDERLKKDISLAGNYLNKICAIPVKNFRYKDQSEFEDITLGVIAQDVLAVAPELISQEGFGLSDNDKEKYLTVYQTDLQYALMKCIQEQQAIIESLKARLDAANL